MTQFEQEQAAKKFIELWSGKGNERSDAQKFWIQLLRMVLGVENSEQYIDFELPIKNYSSTTFADGYIDDTHTLIEMKGKEIDLSKPEKQSDGSMLTPYQQARRYSENLGYTQRARWIVVSNFKEIHIYDMEKPHSDAQIIQLENLYKDYYILNVIVNSEDENIKREEDLSVDAGKIVGKLYRALETEYKKKENDETKYATSINALCVRLVFCLYAEDSGLFGKHMMFHDYLKKYPASELRNALMKLFKILDTPKENRDKFESDDLLEFPYVNGGLFADENIIIPQFTDEIKEVLIVDASEKFNWSEISPTIFGGVFESTLNPDTRRAGGMHYTSVKNIHKVIDALFLDELTYELDKIIATPILKERKKLLLKYQEKLADLKFLDPACGSGNFLTETYLSLRKLENRMLESYYEGQSQFGNIKNNPIKVSINQFYGIEINDFAVTVAKTALWIAEDQMYKKTKEIVMISEDFLPLKSYTQITEGNALRIDWNDVIDKNKLNYIMGNPPFVGFYLQNPEQKEDLKKITGEQTLDYVICWFFKAGEYSKNTNIKCAFVSTNSISQGEQVALIWSKLYDYYNIKIDFAYKTFNWTSESNDTAKVHCVIIGFSNENIITKKFIYDDVRKKEATNISPYLFDGKSILIRNRTKPISNIPLLNLGNRPLDGQKLLLNEEEYNQMISKNAKTKKWIRPFLGSTEFINNKKRYCLWLTGITVPEIKEVPEIEDRVKQCREERLKAKDKQMRKLADTPHLFREQKISNKDYIVLPRVSSSRRKYMPIGYIGADVIAGDALQMIPDAGLYEFGILTSNVHNSWLRAVGGRLKSDFRYGKETVYNTFAWPTPNKEQKQKIESTAQKILDIRKKYSNSSLADLYGDKMYLYPDLVKAHQENDKAVMEAYGFNWRKMSEADCVAELMKMYQKLTENK